MADQLAHQFVGLDDGVTRGKLLAALKGAAQHLQIDTAIVHLIDALFAYTRDVDWKPRQVPVVWPSNEDLAAKLGKSVRQVQNYLRRAQVLGLIAHRDSPNGRRGGARRPDETISWAYGIVLSPIGVRYAEFQTAAREAAVIKRAMKTLRYRLAAARRKIRCLAQTTIDNGLEGLDVDEEVALARMATTQMKGERDPDRLRACVDQIEARQKALESDVAARLQPATGPLLHDNISCSHDAVSVHSTTTTQHQPAKAGYSSGSTTMRSCERHSSLTKAITQVEADLEEHGVGPDFINAVANDLFPEFHFTPPSWGPMIALAERLAAQNAIHSSAWREACSIMGDRGAAASVIATVQKYRAGEVHRPGAYLRGMTGKASKGELRLGKTYHGLKDVGRSTAMRSLAEGDAPRAIGHLSKRLVADLAVRA